jgi:hypothetical protein
VITGRFVDLGQVLSGRSSGGGVTPGQGGRARSGPSGACGKMRAIQRTGGCRAPLRARAKSGERGLMREDTVVWFREIVEGGPHRGGHLSEAAERRGSFPGRAESVDGTGRDGLR